MSKSEETQIPLKILVDKGSNKVLFAEADHSFVDILFGFMTLPMGTIVRLVGENNSDSKFTTIGSFNTLYEGLANLPSECFSTEECKAMLLNPRNSSESYCSQLKLNVEDTIPIKYFICSRCAQCDTLIFSLCNSAKCSCGSLLNWEVSLVEKSAVNTDHRNTGTFVNETATFIITDDLHINPSSLGSSIQMLNDLGITDITNIEERTMYIALQQVLNLLSLALFTNTPLTNLLLREGEDIQELLKCEPSNLTQSRVGKVLEAPTNARNSKKFNAKAFVRKSNGKLLFLQAKGDFIDFLFSFLAIPLGAVEWFLNGTIYVPPSIDNMYTSLSNLSVDQYMKSEDLKDMLLDPPLPLQYMCKNQIFTLNEPSLLTKYYDYKYFGKWKITLNDSKLDGEFVRGTAMFMVTDNLTVTPFSSISTLTYLSKLKIPLSDLEEHEVSIGVEEGLEILKASLTSSSALSEGLKHLLVKKPKQEN